MKKTLLCLCCLVSLSAAKAQTFLSTGSVAIPDGVAGTGSCNPGAAASSLINVTATGTITTPSDVTINVNLDHTFAGDLVVELVAPDGSSCNLINRLGKTTGCSTSDFGSGDGFSGTNTLSFNTANTTPIPTGTSPIPSDNYTPTGGSAFPSVCDLAVFLTGKSVNGNWAVRATDNANVDNGFISSWDINFGPSALPLDLLSFEGRVFEGYNSLEWKTASEKNTAFFELQRSTDGSDYTTIATISAKGEGTHQYAHQDNAPAGNVCYYRLKMTDKGGEFSFSATQRLAIQQHNSGGTVVLPNPAKNQINLTLGNNELSGTHADIINLNGQRVQTFTIDQAKMTLDIAPLPAGIYIIRFTSGTLVKFTKI